MSAHQKSRVDEEDDLDDLDDVLDQFSPPPQAAPSASTSKSPQPAADDNEGLPSDVMDKLTEGMESLLRELRIEPGAASESADVVGEREREQLAAAWEAMLVKGMDEMSDPSASTSSPSPMDYQSRVRSTLNRLKESESGLQSSDPSGTEDSESFQSLMSQWNSLRDSPGDNTVTESEAEVQKMLEEMMTQLLSKNVLYEPLKEMHEKFPEYLTKHASTLSTADKARFEVQISCIKRLVDEFEAPTYRDDDEQASERIVGLMSELQMHGQLPQEIMGPLPPGLDMGADGLPDIPETCNMN